MDMVAWLCMVLAGPVRDSTGVTQEEGGIRRNCRAPAGSGVRAAVIRDVLCMLMGQGVRMGMAVHRAYAELCGGEAQHL